MRIAIIGHKRVPSCEGGIEVVVGELAVRMARKGHEVTVYNRWQRKCDRSPKRYKGISLRDVPTVSIKGSDAVMYSFLATFLALFGRYDVVHFHAEGPAGMSWMTKLFRIPTVVTIHGLDWQREKWNSFASQYIKIAEKIAARCADEMIVLSENMSSYFQRKYGRKTNFIRNGVNTGYRRKPDQIRKLGLKGNDYVLFVARLVPEKGIHYLLEAFRSVDTDLKLVIAGKIDSSEYVKKIREMAALDKRVIMPGFVQGEFQEELYSNCRLYILPSDVEGMSLTLLEALSFGAPCLASDIEENKVVPEKFLTWFNHSRPDDLRRKMEQMLNDSYSEEQREAQILWMRENYSWESVIDDTLSIYQTVIKKKDGQKSAQNESKG